MLFSMANNPSYNPINTELFFLIDKTNIGINSFRYLYKYRRNLIELYVYITRVLT